MKKFLKIVLWIVLIVALIGVWVLGYFGLIPGISAIFGSDQPRDLGAPHTEADLMSGQAKLGQAFVEPSAGMDPYEQLRASAASPVDAQLTNTEYAAHIEQVHPIDDVQVVFAGSEIEVSGRITRSRIPGFLRTMGLTDDSNEAEVLSAIDRYMPVDPVFYFRGGAVAENDDMEITLTEAEFARFPVAPEEASEVLEFYLETIIAQTPSLQADRVTIESGQMHFRGTATAEVPRY